MNEEIPETIDELNRRYWGEREQDFQIQGGPVIRVRVYDRAGQTVLTPLSLAKVENESLRVKLATAKGTTLDGRAPASAAKMLREVFVERRCDDEGVAGCIRCNVLFLIRELEQLEKQHHAVQDTVAPLLKEVEKLRRDNDNLRIVTDLYNQQTSFCLRCNEPFTNAGEIYRCTDCSYLFHKHCLISHFMEGKDLPHRVNEILRMLKDLYARPQGFNWDEARDAIEIGLRK